MIKYKDLSDTYNLLNERLDITKDSTGKQNKIKKRIESIIICDTYNNPFFPITPKPQLDTAKTEILTVFKRYRELYASKKAMFLPCHYCIELVDYNYVVYNTRPINLKFPINNQEASRDYSNNWKPTTELFVNQNYFDISKCIHIWVIGDSNYDMYSNKFYKTLMQIIIEPILFNNKLSKGLANSIFPLNMGVNFKNSKISNSMK
jgi:hypothetical protein